MNLPLNLGQEAVEEVELKGHILDSLLLPKVLDAIVSHSGHYTLKKMQVGQKQDDPSVAHIEVHAPNRPRLTMILDSIRLHGARPKDKPMCHLPVMAVE